jgi:PAP2 superfamily C-terminal
MGKEEDIILAEDIEIELEKAVGAMRILTTRIVGFGIFTQESLMSSVFEFRSVSGISGAVHVDPSVHDEVRIIQQVKASEAVLKLLIILGFLISISIHKIWYVDVEKLPKAVCLYDRLQNWTGPFNSFLLKSTIARKLSIFLTSFYIDCIVVYCMWIWVKSAKNPRLLFSLFLFYGGRAICQAIFSFQFPAGVAFDYPGFPSLMVPYGYTSDFYFSGHVGFLVILSLELNHWKSRALMIINWVAVILVGLVLLISRGHYSIDLFIGAVYGFYCYRMGFQIKQPWTQAGRKIYALLGGILQTTTKKQTN